MMNVAIVGTGYVGLVAGTCFAELGHRVVCVDNNIEKLRKLRAGELPIYEPGLEEMVPRNVEHERLVFTDDLKSAVERADIVFIAVGTPPGEDGSADLTYVVQVAEAIGDALNGFKVVAVKSTVPIGTCDKVRAVIASRSKEHFAVVSNPEFLREGVAVPDFMKPDRIVVGAADDRAIELMTRLYRPLTQNGAKLMFMDVRSSEMTKYASNSMLATRISFMNELANLCEVVGADIENVRGGMGSDNRIGPSFLRAGVGFGGSCFPKDVRALLQTAKEYNSELGVLDSVVAANVRQKVRMVSIIREQLGDDLTGMRFGVWGLAFKPDTDDMREAPAIQIIRGLVEAGATVVAYDPEATETAQAVLENVPTYANNAYACCEGADALILLTEWREFASPDWDRVAGLMRSKTVFDGRNLWEPNEMRERGFNYRGIGRK